MKYIRTKNGIYEVVDTYEVSYVIGYTEDGFEKKVYKEDVIKQSDTIEELCDRFIAETEDTVKFWVESTLKNAKIYCGIKNIYGAIWTSRGLEFVAKMNEDGVLCLI